IRWYSCMAECILPWARYFSAARMAFALSKPIWEILSQKKRTLENRERGEQAATGCSGPATTSCPRLSPLPPRTGDFYANTRSRRVSTNSSRADFMSTPTAENGRRRATENVRAAGWLERAAGRLALAGFIVYAVAAPHSIAGSWMGLSAAVAGWLVRAALKRRTGIRRTALDLPLWLFVGWTVLSCLLSTEPRESIPKLVNVSTFLVFYLAQSILTRRSAVLVAAVLVVSAVAGVLWGVGDLIVGRGVVVTALSSDSPLRAATPLGE